MNFISTRGGISPVSYEETLFSGYAPDGGLYMPEKIPKLDKLTLDQWKESKLSYPQVVEKIVRLFVKEEEISSHDLTCAVDRAYSKFNVTEKIGFNDLKSASGKSFVLAQLYHGRTASFKDYAMCLVGQFIEHFSNKRATRTVILVSFGLESMTNRRQDITTAIRLILTNSLRWEHQATLEALRWRLSEALNRLIL